MARNTKRPTYRTRTGSGSRARLRTEGSETRSRSLGEAARSKAQGSVVTSVLSGFDRTRLLILGVVAAVIVCIIVAISIAGAGESPADEVAEIEEEAQAEPARTIPFAVAADGQQSTIAGLQELGDEKGPFSFQLSADPTKAVSEPLEKGRLKSGFEEVEDTFDQYDYDFGFVALDIETGEGYAYNIDHEFYGASSYKGIFLSYVFETLLDAGKVDRTEELENSGEHVKWMPTSQVFEELVADMVTYSDDNCYKLLRENYGTFDEYEEWLDALGMSLDDFGEEHWYPHYTVRKAAIFWLHIYDYINSGNENSEWLSELYQGTEISFIRDVVVKEHGLDATVMNKSGWIGEEELHSTIDNGLIEIDGKTYLLISISSIPYSEATSEYFYQLERMLISDAIEPLAGVEGSDEASDEEGSRTRGSSSASTGSDASDESYAGGGYYDDYASYDEDLDYYEEDDLY